MKNQLALLSLATQITALAAPSLSNRGEDIVGGQTVKIEDFPYQIQMLRNGNTHCGGTVVSDRFVVTAAHWCDWPGDTFSILAGSGEKGKVRRPTTSYDACVLEVTPLALGPTVQPVAVTNVEPAVGTDTIVSGFGLLYKEHPSYPKYLQVVHVPIMDRDVYVKQYQVAGDNITADMICAGLPEGGKDFCNGDSGGPLIANGSSPVLSHLASALRSPTTVACTQISLTLRYAPLLRKLLVFEERQLFEISDTNTMLSDIKLGFI
ncbi:hypothetical protein VHEMI05441 [[Torrubiella] hemipterigena]|uniref:Peptidase S1 domain-containing protein n=1 Tax=[Torrubiella] hemipterigena TaxID=1531966 RepID=A0A0A1SXY7_9HYPO|nr:hypothetical protein VHEMI05441 [[Torrubiella] hemipterigena]